MLKVVFMFFKLAHLILIVNRFYFYIVIRNKKFLALNAKQTYNIMRLNKERNKMLNKPFLNCLLAPTIVLIIVSLTFLIIGVQSTDSINNYITLFLEPFTYCCYAFAFGVIICHLKPFQTRQQKTHISLFFILYVCAILREMGIQHWLTKTDTTAFKLRFFTNPNNPIDEKIVSALLLITVFSIILYLLIYYFPKIIRGFFNLNPIYWTVATLGGTGIVCKFADRLPSNLMKHNIDLSVHIRALTELFEETTEFCLPLICAIGFVQFARLIQQKNK